MIPIDILSLLILLLCIVLFAWEPIPTCVTAMLGCVLMVVTGVTTFAGAFSGFSSDTIILFASMLIVGQTLMETGAAAIIGKKIVQLARGREKVFLALSCIVAFSMSMFLANTAVIAMFLALVAGVASTTTAVNIRNMMLPIAISAIIGGISTIVGSTQQLVAQGLMKEMYGEGFGFFEFLRITAPIAVVALAYFLTWGYKRGMKVWGDRDIPEMVVDGIRRDDAGYDRNKMLISVVIFGLTVIAFLFQIAATGIIALCAALLCLGTRCISIKAAQTKPCWNLVIWLAGCLGLGKGLTDGGAGTLIANVLVQYLGDVDVYVLFALLCLFTMALSTFMSSATATLVFLTAALPLCQALGYNSWAFSMGIVLSAAIVFLTPLANGHVGMVLGAGYKFSDYFKVYWPLSIAVYAIIVVLVPIWYPLVN